MVGKLRLFWVLGLLTCLAACSHPVVSPDAARPYATPQVLAFTETLAADALSGRAAGTPGNAKARALILERYQALGLTPPPGAKSYQQPFKFGDFAPRQSGKPNVSGQQGINLVASLPNATAANGAILMVTAHYDHLGIRDGEIYNGADDNASGVAAMLAVADYFTQNPPTHEVWFVAFDAEEQGLRGARHFVRTLAPDIQSRIALNLNLDMVSRGDNDILWASGVSHWPSLKPVIKSIAATAPVTLKMGFDTGEGYNNWTELSDHAAFYQAGIPHIYLGVEDHPDYHKPSDDFDKIDPDWFLESVTTIIMIAATLEAELSDLLELKQR